MGKRERPWRIDYVSPVREYFDRGGEIEVSRLLMENSADSLRTSLDHYNSVRPSNSQYKHVILLLDHSIETLLKARLSLDAKASILRARNTSILDQTLGIRKSIEELRNKNIILEDNFEMALLDLHKVRNDIWHFGFKGRKDPLDSLISFCACVYWVFLMKHMPEHGIRTMLGPQQFSTLMSFESRWHFANISAIELMYEWHQTRDVEQIQYSVWPCKECLTFSAIIDNYAGSGRCRCCGQEYKASDFTVGNV